ncbi:Acetyltransferase (GNAT) family protein [Pseudovibrio ascidiaceicola]|uniref:Acetyltransferase (GNAT) family protein n=1 Tax=Pseudovibrio ascidiaceicola TaxID=285279 RepID=A0A1I3X1Y3_9HYPH|nr:GNAT family N-acetyltransferase [Pseudovibrio ascidiaceicola]SFK13812.1 Acetyltransferase (GNAT) family protein [Pseudovibrio ascidiaceicola]
MIALQDFPAARFDEFQIISVSEYAQDLMDNRGMEEHAALKKAEDGLLKAFPEGKSNEHNKLLSIMKKTKAGQVEVGFLWYSLQDDASAFIMDFLVYSEHRGKGYASKALEALKATFKKDGLTRIGLRVAPDNHGAIRTYYKAGFNVTGWNMSCEF